MNTFLLVKHCMCTLITSKVLVIHHFPRQFSKFLMIIDCINALNFKEFR